MAYRLQSASPPMAGSSFGNDLFLSLMSMSTFGLPVSMPHVPAYCRGWLRSPHPDLLARLCQALPALNVSICLTFPSVPSVLAERC